MTAVWAIDLADSQKIVLLALADCANDEGHCWPSMATLAKKCSKGERTVQGVIKQLVDGGHLTREEVLGKGCKYVVHPRSDCAPQSLRPRKHRATPPQPLRDTPAAAADKPSKNHQEPSVGSKAREPFPPDWVPAEPWSAFVEMRREGKGVFTLRAAKLIVTELENLRAKGHDPGAVLDQSTRNAWKDVYELKDKGNGRQVRNTDTFASLRGQRPNPALDMVLAAEAELAAEAQRQNPGPDWPPRAALPSR